MWQDIAPVADPVIALPPSRTWRVSMNADEFAPTVIAETISIPSRARLTCTGELDRFARISDVTTHRWVRGADARLEFPVGRFPR
jgi:hypothetical protein